MTCFATSPSLRINRMTTRSRRRARSHSARVAPRRASNRRWVSLRLSPSAAPASSQTGTTFSVPDATSRTRTAQPLIGSRMTTVWLACAAMTPGAISNRSGVSGSRLDTRDLPVSAIMEREKITWSHHGGRIRGTDDGCTIARESNAAITKSCTNQGSTAVLVDDGLSHHERRKVSF
jgi:hypothetical protein